MSETLVVEESVAVTAADVPMPAAPHTHSDSETGVGNDPGEAERPRESEVDFGSPTTQEAPGTIPALDAAPPDGAKEPIPSAPTCNAPAFSMPAVLFMSEDSGGDTQEHVSCFGKRVCLWATSEPQFTDVAPTSEPAPEPASPTFREPPLTPKARPQTEEELIEGSGTVQLCRKTYQGLKKPGLTDEQREVLMRPALYALLVDADLPDMIHGELCARLHDIAPAAYRAWINGYLGWGLLQAVATAPISARSVNNIIRIFRPQLAAELKLDTVGERAMLETALIALFDYTQATREVHARHASPEFRSDKVAAQHMRILATAQPMLRMFEATLEHLQTRRQRPVLNVKATNVAVQFNGSGTECQAPAASQLAAGNAPVDASAKPYPWIPQDELKAEV